MFDLWNQMSLLERSLALRIASLALESLAVEPSRSLDECIRKWVHLIPAVLDEHLPWLETAWADAGRGGSQDHRYEATMAAIWEIESTAELMLERQVVRRPLDPRSGE